VEGVRNNDTERLTQCLRTYALIDKARQAEALYRQAVVAPFVAKVGQWCDRPLYGAAADLTRCEPYRAAAVGPP